MIWVYALIGLAVGLIIGALAVRLGSSKLREQEAMKRDLDKNKAELEEYRKELVSHFARSAELLDNMAKDYRQLYQHMAKSSSELMPGLPAQDNPFNYRLTEADSDQPPVKLPPRDYSDGSSGLFRPAENKES